MHAIRARYGQPSYTPVVAAANLPALDIPNSFTDCSSRLRADSGARME